MIDVFTPKRISSDWPFQKQLETHKDFDFDSVVCILTPQNDAHRRAWLCNMMHTAEFFKKFEYLGKMEIEFENILACLSGAWMGSNNEKNGGRKSRDTLPLKVILF